MARYDITVSFVTTRDVGVNLTPEEAKLLLNKGNEIFMNRWDNNDEEEQLLQKICTAIEDNLATTDGQMTLDDLPSGVNEDYIKEVASQQFGTLYEISPDNKTTILGEVAPYKPEKD